MSVSRGGGTHGGTRPTPFEICQRIQRDGILEDPLATGTLSARSPRSASTTLTRRPSVPPAVTLQRPGRTSTVTRRPGALADAAEAAPAGSQVQLSPGVPSRHTFARSARVRDRKSTRLNSSHLGISYAVFCLKQNNTP